MQAVVRRVSSVAVSQRRFFFNLCARNQRHTAVTSIKKAEVIKCRAAVVWEPHRQVIETVQVAPPKPHEVRIRVLHSGVCHSDAFVLEGIETFGKNQYPCILGHEGAGIVESVGEGVTSVAPGDSVIPLFSAQCGECAICKHPTANYCDKLTVTQMQGLMPDGTTRFTCNGKAVHHFSGCSTFSEYTVVPDISVCKINPSAPKNRACLVGCGISTGYGSAVNIAKVKPQSTCAIWGLGAIGLAVAMGCKNAGAKRIIGIDINPKKFNDTARRLGVTEFLNPNDHDKPIATVVKKLTSGGADYTFECVGNVNAVESALESARQGWGVSVVVGLSPASEKVSFRASNLLMGKSWLGGLFGGYKSRDSVPKLVEHYLKGDLMVDEFVTHELPLDQINLAFEYLKTGQSIRTVINVSQ